jgi:formylmethanofuran:tetrahydromethanopterin formyltransferase
MRENLYQKYHKIANVSRVASTTYESIESSNDERCCCTIKETIKSISADHKKIN